MIPSKKTLLFLADAWKSVMLSNWTINEEINWNRKFSHISNTKHTKDYACVTWIGFCTEYTYSLVINYSYIIQYDYVRCMCEQLLTTMDVFWSCVTANFVVFRYFLFGCSNDNIQFWKVNYNNSWQWIIIRINNVSHKSFTLNRPRRVARTYYGMHKLKQASFSKLFNSG